VASKVSALNAGDAAAAAPIRIFLDADIVLSLEAVQQLIMVLDTQESIVAAPRVRFNLERATRGVRSFYEVFMRLPYVTDNLVGLGVYGLSPAGRARFGDFPELISDDLFVQRLFGAQERILVDATFEVQVPRTLHHLLRVRTRIAKGNAQLASMTGRDHSDVDFSSSTGTTANALLDVLRTRPALLPHAIVYTAVTVAARLRARRSVSSRWERDTSTR